VKSWEVLKVATEAAGVKAVAARLKVSSALVYKWCQPPAAEEQSGSGAWNPLDRLRLLWEVTRDPRIINWLCSAAGGFYVANPAPPNDDRQEELLGTTQRVVHEFGELLSDISESIENDGMITSDEAELIRHSWERLKSASESFVVACERGVYGRPRT
jgi:hypothetical protein